MNNKEAVDYLNNILQYLNDSLDGYKLNREDVSEPQLKATLQKLCQDRMEMIEEIKSKISELDGSPTDRNTVAGTIHQWYQDFKNAITGGEPLAVSRQIRFGESILIDEYKSTLNEELPEDIRQLLLNQLTKIEDGLKEVELEVAKSS